MRAIKKLFSTLLVFILIALINPIGVNAAWKQDNHGWWYTEGSSWATDWKQIDGKWYHFKSNGYLDQNAWTCYGYYVNSNGEWTATSKYTRNDILKNGIGFCKSGLVCYEAGDQSNLDVINNEPCIYTWDKDDKDKFIGMNTLNVYEYNGTKVDEIIL